MNLSIEQANILVKALQLSGMEAGFGIRGSSSYPIIGVVGGFEVWGYVPTSLSAEADDEAEDLIAWRLLETLRSTAPAVWQ